MGELLEEMKNQSMDRSRLVGLKEEMTPEEYDDFMIALKDRTISASAICRAINKRGYAMSVSTLTVMRRNMK